MKENGRVVERLLDTNEESLLDLLDHVLNKGVMAAGDLTLGVAGIDLIYVRLSALLCAADRVLPKRPEARKRNTRSRHRRKVRR
jgi:Gas vesicle protein